MLLLVFMYVFCFNIYSIIDSSILVGLFLGIQFLLKKDYRKIVLSLATEKKYKIFYALTLLLIIWCIVTTSINKVYDFIYLKTFIHYIITIIIGIGLVSYMNYKGKLNQIVNYLIYAFIIQSVLQCVFYMFPSFSAIFNYLRSDDMIRIGATYNKFRGIAITKSGFFSLSSSYAIVFVLYFSKYNTITKNIILKYIILCILIIGTFFAGRTGLIGLIYASVIAVVIKMMHGTIKENIKHFLIIFLVLIGASLIIFATSKIDKAEKLYSYVFESFYNISKGKSFQTKSGQILKEMYNIEVSAKTVIIGDGKYIDYKDGRPIYYQSTDAGYCRKILYFGMIGIVISSLIQFSVCNYKEDKKNTIILLILLLLLEIKGEIIGINIMVNSIVILYSEIMKINKDVKA